MLIYDDSTAALLRVQSDTNTAVAPSQGWPPILPSSAAVGTDTEPAACLIDRAAPDPGGHVRKQILQIAHISAEDLVEQKRIIFSVGHLVVSRFSAAGACGCNRMHQAPPVFCVGDMAPRRHFTDRVDQIIGGSASMPFAGLVVRFAGGSCPYSR